MNVMFPRVAENAADSETDSEDSEYCEDYDPRTIDQLRFNDRESFVNFKIYDFIALLQFDNVIWLSDTILACSVDAPEDVEESRPRTKKMSTLIAFNSR
jgi:hypothetical protein